MTNDPKSENEKRDDVLKRMLGTPPKTHDESGATKTRVKRERKKASQDSSVDALEKSNKI
jgi:hypothetical protein